MSWLPRIDAFGGNGRRNDRSPDNASAAPSLHGGPGESLSPATRRRRLLIQSLLSALGGLLTSLAYPDANLWWVAPFGVATLMLATRDLTLRAGWGMGMLYGAVLHLRLISWTGIFLGWIPRGSLTFLMALYLGLTGLGLAAAWRVRRSAVVPALACWWVTSEAVASRFPWGGFGWTRLAFSQGDAPTLGLASVGGAPLVSLAVALAGAALAMAAHTVLGEPGVRRVVLLNGLAALVMAGGMLIPRPTGAQNGTLNVLGVQGNAQPRLDFNDRRREVLDNHARVAQSAAAQIRAGKRPRPDLMVWPENSSDLDPVLNSDAAGVINRAVDAVGVPALIGGLRILPDRVVENTSWLWLPSSGRGTGYVKQLPVPFVETVPWRSFFVRIAPMLKMAGNMRAGDTLGQFQIGHTTVGDLICFEIVSDSLVRRTVDAGAKVVVLQTNNATFGYTAESTQQLAITRLRAVEHGRAFLQISTVGVSGFVSPDGTVSDATQLYTAAAVQRAVPLRTTRTVADRLGAAPEFLVAIGGMLGLVIGVRNGRSSGSRPVESVRERG